MLSVRLPCEQPVRFVAVFVFGPLLIWRGVVAGEWFVFAFGVGLIMVDGVYVTIGWLRDQQPSRQPDPEEAVRAMMYRQVDG